MTPNVKYLIIKSRIFVRKRDILQNVWEYVMLHLGGHGITRKTDPIPERRFETERRFTSMIEENSKFLSQ